MYVVTRFGLEMKSGGPASVPGPAAASEGRPSGRRPPKPPDRPTSAAAAASPSEPTRCRAGAPPPGEARAAGARPPRPEEEPAAPLERPLGRALVEEIDDLDDAGEEVPSYGAAQAGRQARGPSRSEPAAQHGRKPAARTGRARGEAGGGRRSPRGHGSRRPSPQRRAGPRGPSRSRARPKPARRQARADPHRPRPTTTNSGPGIGE